MQIETNEIVKFCEKYLKIENFKDSCVNGLQVEGAPQVGKIITGVSLSEEIIKIAIQQKAQMLIVHHGLSDKQIPTPIQIKGIVKNRLKLLLENNINLCRFHLPLDGHPIIGNNISLLKLLNLKKVGIIHPPYYGHIGFIGQTKTPISFQSFVKLVNDKLQTKSYVIPAGPKNVSKIGIISGGAEKEFVLATKAGADTYLTGSICESMVAPIKETKINFINAGHYNTEKLGIQNLGNLIAKKFNIEVEFVDVPCDV